MILLQKAEVDNKTVITEFVLLGFGKVPELQTLLFLVFLVIYVATMVGNILIIILVVADQHLHTPMYFFLGNLSCVETCYSSILLPQMLTSLLTGDRTISISRCIAQFYWFALLACTECYLLAAMSYDRYLAICKPLRYSVLMNGRSCLWLAAGSWLWAFVASTTGICLMSQLTFCGPGEIDHFFCDLNPLIKRACHGTELITRLSFILTSIGVPFPFLLTLASYVCIISTILRIPSATGKQKAFSTCSSHLTVVTLFYGTITIVYILPDTDTLRDLNKVFSVFYTVLTPLANPLIYSLRNKEVRQALRKITCKLMVLKGI
uniref:Olfactory receptor n=1 Tax=Pelodiscus sinensis TaxID=13735 RepID=K7EYG0_PELSI|nr:olfactory receptor 6B1-like [Pelodiscus sinensis]|eukprot:XP_006115897.1 olfactory receptor 6B1-like [Pelodiscus sinensis]